MRIQAICAAGYEISVKKAAGVRPILSPPLVHTTFTKYSILPCDFLYVKLHGLPEQPFWYGDHFQTTCSDVQVAELPLDGATVFAANCFLPESPMLQALFSAGAENVIGGSGSNYAGKEVIRGADRLGRSIRRLMSIGFSASKALSIGKVTLRLLPDSTTADTLEFELWQQ